MRLRVCLILGGLTFALFALPIFGQPGAKKPPEAKPATSLPITRVVLFNAGIGYFHREGTITDTARVDLKVNEEDVNDLILTLVANDPSGTSRAVTYDNRAPADITLKAFSIDLTENPSVGNLLHQVRGEKVDITDVAGIVVSGNIVSVEKPTATVLSGIPTEEGTSHRTVIPPPAGAIEQVSLLTEDGLQTVALTRIKKVKFIKPDLQAEFRKALEALAAARGANTKSVGVTFNGKGERKVSVGYVADAPLWKPTYRVMLSEAAAKLVGLAAIENTTDEDWENVGIKLMSGRPITFKMDLYDPLFIPRPVVEPDLYASLRPPVYQGPGQSQLGGQLGIQGGMGGFAGFGGGMLGSGVGNQGNLGVGGGISGNFGFQSMRGGSLNPSAMAGGYGSISRPSVRSLLGDRLDYDTRLNRLQDPSAGGAPGGRRPPGDIPTASDLKNLGEAFEYTVKQPVSLPRFKSALLPILDEKVEAQRLSIYNAEILGNHPLKGLRLTNSSKLFVAQGPVTVYDGDTVAGQARLPDVKPGESRLLSYAIDLDVTIRKSEADVKRTPVSLGISLGTLRQVTRVKSTQKYTAINKSAEAKTLWVTQVIKPEWKLITPNKPVEMTGQLYRFELKLPASDKATLEVIEETDETNLSNISTLSTDDLEKYQRESFTPPAVKTAIGKVLAARQALTEVETGIKDEQAALKEIAEEQVRIRANMGQAPKESEAFKRYLKKFDDQETEIEKRQTKLKELLKTKERRTKEQADLLKTLSAE